MRPHSSRTGEGTYGTKAQQSRSLKRKREEEDVEKLALRVKDFDPAAPVPPENFVDLPLSRATQDGLSASHFKTLTTIQSRTIPFALQGSDVLGAAKTGSGKTLSFLVPVLENLYRKRWTSYDGVGALILSPTRELAIQIFDVLRKVGRHHTFSAGLVIGGKNLQEERERLGRMNILVATPGRMLQHMDQTADLDIGNLQMLILDEADRIMDMGFSQTIDALIEHLPPDRQTLMFSATQTKKVSDLARLSLNEPEFVSVHESADSATPSTLQQNYVVIPLPEKLDTLWSFLRANVKKKILVFASSGKQVRFVYEAFRHLQPGIPLLHLHGRQKQTARLDITTKFSDSKSICLFSTDVAARGLDFPSVDWVVQLDCPEDADTYIHRVGRTARFERDGRAILFLDPSEQEGMLAALSKKRVVLEQINVRQKKMQHSIRNQLQNMCFQDPELKYLGQKAFVSYVRSVHIQKDKNTFDVRKLDLEGFAACLGLPGTPRVKYIEGQDAKARKNAPRQLLAAFEGFGSSDSDEAPDGLRQTKQKAEVRTRYDRMFERRNQGVLAAHYTNLIEDDPSEAEPSGGEKTYPLSSGRPQVTPTDEDDFLSVKRRFTAGDEELGQAQSANDPEASSIPQNIKTIHLSSNPTAQPLTIDSHRREKILRSKKALLKYKGNPTHLTFSSDDDAPKNKMAYKDEESFASGGKDQAAVQRERQEFLAREGEWARNADQADREVERQKRREKKERRKERDRAERQGRTLSSNKAEVDGVQLIPYDEGEDNEMDETNFNGGPYDSDNSENTGPTRQKKSRKSKESHLVPEFQGGIYDSNAEVEKESNKKRKSKKGKRSRQAEEGDLEVSSIDYDMSALRSSSPPVKDENQQTHDVDEYSARLPGRQSAPSASENASQKLGSTKDGTTKDKKTSRSKQSKKLQVGEDDQIEFPAFVGDFESFNVRGHSPERTRLPAHRITPDVQTQSGTKRTRKSREDAPSSEADEASRKKARKSKSTSTSASTKPSRVGLQEPQTLEELEALASGLLSRS
jgi:ATP-dependent RNA helicase DDX10/DBP4